MVGRLRMNTCRGRLDLMWVVGVGEGCRRLRVERAKVRAVMLRAVMLRRIRVLRNLGEAVVVILFLVVGQCVLLCSEVGRFR